MKQPFQTAPPVFKDESPCPYFSDGRVSTIEYFIPGSDDIPNYHIYLARGYRRMGRVFYRNVCFNCSECRPVRLEQGMFRAGRSQKRTLRKNRDVRIEIHEGPSISAEKIALYSRYVKSKHGTGIGAESVREMDILLNIHYGYPYTIEMNYYLDNRLIGVGIIDEGKDSLSSNYFYYDTDYLERRLGVFSIVQEISLARSLGKKYYYLGFYIEENPKMSYKKYFRPNQVLEEGAWKEFHTAMPRVNPIS